MPLSRRTSLRTKTLLRRSGRIKVKRSTIDRMTLPPAVREEVMRSQTKCAVCGNDFSPIQHQEIHHIFYKSHIRLKGVRDQIWNLARLHDDPRFENRSGGPLLCHDAAHKDKNIRHDLEDVAIEGLRDLISRAEIGEEIALDTGVDAIWKLSDPQLLRAYERWWVKTYGKK